MDWKAFLLGKPFRKFDPRQYLEFRLFHDFSTGIIDQWMTHMIDTVHLLTGAKTPRSPRGGAVGQRSARSPLPEGMLGRGGCQRAAPMACVASISLRGAAARRRQAVSEMQATHPGRRASGSARLPEAAHAPKQQPPRFSRAATPAPVL